MKIIAIVSSPKGKNSLTRQLVDAALEGAREAGAETGVIDVARTKINYCKGCVTCYKTGKCAQKDEYPGLKERLLEADGIILSSPNYIDGVTAQLKTFFDRSANFIHEQLLDGKYAVTLTTAGGGGDDKVLAVMNTFVGKSGGLVVGSASFTAAQGPSGMDAGIKKAHDLGRDMVEAIKEDRRYPTQEAARDEFRKSFGYSVKYNKEKWAHNYQVWVEKGWLRV